MFYVLQVYLLYMLQVYVLQQLYVVASLGLLDFQGSSNVSSLPLYVSGSSFTNVDICIWSTPSVYQKLNLDERWQLLGELL